MDSSTQIKCPNCGTTIDVQDILAHQLEEEIRHKYQSQLAVEQKKFEQEQEQLDKARQEFEEKKRKENELFQERIDARLKEERGGDCIHIVNTRTHQNCGKIYYESKRTKDFQGGWIEKFKADMREKGADVGVLVTEARPAGFDRLGIIDGVWVCSYEEFKGLCAVLRESVIQLNTALCSQENKGDKMHLLYDFLTSTTFRMQVEAIVEGFSCMKTALESEKRSMQRIWKEREKQIDKVITNTIDMYASIKGIAGNAVQSVKALELPEGGLSEDDIDDLNV